MKKILLWMLAAWLFTACAGRGERLEISGNITSADEETLHFYAMRLTGIEEIDSIKLDSKGSFRFNAPRTAAPEFYCLRVGRQIINLAVDSTEHIIISADYSTMGTEYDVKGSQECRIIKEISVKLVGLQRNVEAVLNDKSLTIGEQERLAQELVAQYKAEMKKNYILNNPSGASAYFALFQTLGGQLIFDPKSDRDDIRYAGAVATAWDALYPGSDRAENLRNIAVQGMMNMREPTVVTLDDLGDKVTVAGSIDISLTDIEGNVRSLSELKGKVVLLDFTAYSLPVSQAHNLSLRELYDKYSPLGFEVFQVSLDADEHYWATACEHLPWTCVRDGEGLAGAAASYVVQALPTFFLIDRNGDLVARDEQIDDVEEAVKALCGA